MTAESLLAVFGHPDDESLSAGGWLASHSASGGRTAVVTATWAEDSPRASELAEALRILGAGKPRMLGYADAHIPESAPGRPRLCDAPLDEAVGRLVTHIREFRPEVVVTHDAYGGVTGHPDHLHTNRLTTLAVEAAGLEQLYPDAGSPWHPPELYLATHPHSALATLRDLIGVQKAVYTVPDERVSVRLAVTPWLETKVAAVVAHRSQVDRGALPGLIASLPPDGREALLSTEWYIRHSLDRPTGHRHGELTRSREQPGTSSPTVR